MEKSISLLIAVAIFCAVRASGESGIIKVLEDFKIVPGKVPELLKVDFDSGASVNLGNLIKPSDAKNPPKIDWNADENAFYTLICADPDAPFPENPFLGEFVTWMVGNIPGKDIKLGQILVEYLTPAIPRGAKMNRIPFLLFKQPSKVQFDFKPIDKFTLDGRVNFSVKDFAEKYELGSPAAANYYRTDYDDYVMSVYNQLNCCFELNAPL